MRECPSWRVRRPSPMARAAWIFCKARDGSVAVEAAVAIMVLVVAFAGVMEIVRSAYVADTMGRAARAAARAVALAPDAKAGTLGSVACAAIRRELHLDEGFDCSARWNLTIDTGLAPAALHQSGGGREGDMVRVRIAWDPEPLTGLLSALSEDEGETPQEIAIAVARQEVGMTLHTGSNGSALRACLRGTFVSGRDLAVKTVGPGRPCRYVSEPIEGERTDRTPNTAVPV